MSPIDPAALRRGEPAAVDALYRQHADDVLRWVIRLGGPDLDVEAVAHDVFETALRRVGAFRGQSSTRTWLFGVTRRVVANARRRAALRRVLGLEQVPEPRCERGEADAEVEQLRRRRRVQAALERLGRSQREVVVLADLEGYTAPEVAELLGLPVGTVYSRLHGARRALRAALEAEGLGPDGLPAGGEVVALDAQRQR